MKCLGCDKISDESDEKKLKLWPADFDPDRSFKKAKKCSIEMKSTEQLSPCDFLVMRWS